MLGRWGRLFVAFATALAAWVVATPARADAPLCDHRGATMFAPAPQLQAPETSIDIGPKDASDETCFDALARARAATVENGRAPNPAPPSVGVDLTVPQAGNALRLLEAPWVPSPEARDVTNGERSGVRSRVDRPPR